MPTLSKATAEVEKLTFNHAGGVRANKWESDVGFTLPSQASAFWLIDDPQARRNGWLDGVGPGSRPSALL